MHSLKTSYAGQIFALAKPHDSVGKRTRNRIPKEERKALVETFIKKHQNLNNGSFPSLSLTHKEVGGSFYTIREIVREIIQDNRVLGPGDMILEGNGSDHLRDQSLSHSNLTDLVPPLSLSPDGFHSVSDEKYNFSYEAGEVTKSPEKGENVNGSQVSLDDIGSDVLNHGEVNGTQFLKEDVELLVHQSVDSADITKTQFQASTSEENDINHDAGLHDRVQTIYDSFATKPEDEELDVGKKDKRFESEGSKPVNKDGGMNDAGADMTEMANMSKNTVGTIDTPVEETFPLRSVTSTTESLDVQPSELDKDCEGGKETETKVKTESSIVKPVDLGEISSPTSAVLEENGTEVITGQTPNLVSVPIVEEVKEEIVNPALVDVERLDTKEPVVVKIHETKEVSNGTLTTDQKIPTSGTEQSGSGKHGTAKGETMSSHARNGVTNVEKATTEKGKFDASDKSSSQKENIATLNRIKPESWKGQSEMAGRDEANPLLAILKSLVTAFVKFWSE